MKKNMLTIIILALCLINLVLSAMIIFVVVPSSSKSNKFLAQVASAIQLDVGEDKTEPKEEKVKPSDIVPYKIEKELKMNLKRGSDGKDHAGMIDFVTLSINKNSKDYKKLNKTIVNNESFITDTISEVISAYPYETAITSKEIMKKDILEKIQEHFDSTFIFDISFENLIFQ